MARFVPPARPRVQELVERFPSLCVAVVGDLMLDQFLYGVVERISPEAPVPVVEVEREVFRLGGAANVARNLRTLGARVEIVGVVGADWMAQTLRAELRDLEIGAEGLVAVDGRPTALKTRVLAQHQQVIRFDRERRGPVPKAAVAHMVDRVVSRMAGLDAVVISDYGKGVVSADLMAAVLPSAKKRGAIVAVDPKPQNAALYRGADVLTPNVKETELMAGMPARSDGEAAAAGSELLKRLDARAVLVTRGEKGMTLVAKGAEPTVIPTLAKDVFDVTGAGDTAISALTLAWAAGADLGEAAYVANLAAGIVVGKLGTAAVSPDELRVALSNRARKPSARQP